MTQIVAIILQKGGVGKTTTTANLGAALSKRGLRVLAIDADPQASLTDLWGLTEQVQASQRSIYDVLQDKASIQDLIIELPGHEHYHLVPSMIDLASAESTLAGATSREYILADRLAPVLQQNLYDWILIDCPPSLGLLTINALTAANWYLLPVETEVLAVRGAELLDGTVKQVKRRPNPGLQMLAVVPTKYQRTRHGNEVLSHIRATYGELATNPIPHAVAFKDAILACRPLVDHNPKTDGAQAYEELADEVIRRAS